MSFRTVYRLSLTFSGPLLSQAAGTLAFGVDTAMQRHAGRPVLNGSLVRGNIRYALEKFYKLLDDEQLADDIIQWFGDETSDDRFTPQRAAVEFDFFWQLSDTSQETDARRTRIAIEEDTGKVERGALQVIEDCFPANGQSPQFEGKINASFQSGAQKRRFLDWIGKALDYIPAMGSFKGIGFGRLETWRLEEIKQKESSKSSAFSLPKGASRFALVLHLDRPFCLGRPRTPDSNRIVSDDTIPGSAIKGVIARQFRNDHDELKKQLCFDDLIITHALPANRATITRRKPLPLSLAIYHKQVVDMAGLLKKPDSIIWDQAPTFQPDWKYPDYAEASKALGIEQVKPERILTVRTEIDRNHGISAESRLFTLECIDPQNHVWCADIELCQIPQEKRQDVCNRLLQIFRGGLYGIGKTKAQARIDLLTSPLSDIREMPSPIQEHHYIVTLRTPARLLPQNFAISSINSHQVLKAAYQAYWSLQHSGIELHSFYAQQGLQGTWYHQRQHSPDNDYYPEWLSQTGSVFVLKITESSALQLLEQWCRTGLPAHPNADGSKANWRTTPFLPEHGFGEIMVNDPAQVRLSFRREDEQ